MGLNNEANLYFKVRAESVEGDDEKVGREWTRASKAAAGRTEKFVMNICLWHAPGKEGGQVRGSEGGKIWDRVSRAWGKRNEVEHDVMGALVQLFWSGLGARRVHPKYTLQN